MVVATVHNTGGRALDMYGTLQLTAGPGGLRVGPFPANLGVTLAIGDSEPVTIVLDRRLPAGPWDAGVTLHSGLISNSAQATITFPSTAAGNPPYLAIVGLVIALLGITTLVVVIRRRNSTPTAQRSSDGGHGNLSIGGHRKSPLTAIGSPHGWPSDLPTTVLS